MAHVFVADADSTVRSSLVLLLKHKLGIQEICEIADAGQLDVDLLQCHPDLLILDWDLPGLNIAQIRGQLQSKGRQTVLVVMSVQPQNESGAIASGADAFLCKSAPGEDVLDLLRGFLSNR